MNCSTEVKVDVDLPPSLTRLAFGGYPNVSGRFIDFFRALRDVVDCIGRGAQLRSLICRCAEVFLQHAQWGGEQLRRLGGQLGGLRELEVSCVQVLLLSVVGTIASGAPSLVRLKIQIPAWRSHQSAAPALRASGWSGIFAPPRAANPVCAADVLPGCARLREVVVHFKGKPIKGAAVNIRCHCCSQRCIVPEEVYAGDNSEA